VKAKSTKPVESEIAGEMAASLGLAAQRMEKALEACSVAPTRASRSRSPAPLL
jgi:hypothetical protein